jgi:hypothetical protein
VKVERVDREDSRLERVSPLARILRSGSGSLGVIG